MPWLYPRDHVLEHFDVIVDGAPHYRYRALELKWPFIDIWNLVGRGGLVQKQPGPVLAGVR